MTLLFTFIFLLLTLGGIDILKSYRHYYRKELKARSLEGDALASKLYLVSSYQESLDLFLYLLIALFFTITFFLLNSLVPAWLSFIFLFLLVLLAFVWLPNLKATYFGIRVAKLLARPISYVLDFVHPYLYNLAVFLRANFKKNEHIYDLKDLKNKLDDIYHDKRSGIKKEQVKLLTNVVEGLDIEVGKIATPWKKLKFVYPEDILGPIILNEMHKRGQKIIPVIDDKKNKELMGLINIERFDVNKDSSVKSKLERPIFYIDENSSLIDAFLTFAETNYAAFVVIDSNQRNVGLLTLGDLMEKITKGLTFVAPEEEENEKVEEPEVKEEN